MAVAVIAFWVGQERAVQVFELLVSYLAVLFLIAACDLTAVAALVVFLTLMDKLLKLVIDTVY